MATPRAVRIPRSAPSTAGPGPAERTPAGSTDETVLPNRAGRQRAIRLATIYLVALLAMYLTFVGIDRAGPGGGGSVVTEGLWIFSAVAAALAAGGLVLTLSPAPRSVEIARASLVVVEWTGRRRTFPPLGELRVEVVRRYPASFLSGDPVEAVELTGGKFRRTYQLTEGMLPEFRPERGRAAL